MVEGGGVGVEEKENDPLPILDTYGGTLGRAGGPGSSVHTVTTYSDPT